MLDNNSLSAQRERERETPTFDRNKEKVNTGKPSIELGEWTSPSRDLLAKDLPATASNTLTIVAKLKAEKLDSNHL